MTDNTAIVKAAVSAAKAGTKAIDKNRTAIRTSADKLNNLIHQTAMMILRHAAPQSAGGNGFGDCSRAQFLLFDLPASYRRTMLRDWFHAFSPIVVKDKEEGWNAKMHKPDSKLFVEWNLEAADDMPFWKMAETTPEEKVYDLEALIKMVERLSGQITKKIEEGKVKPEDVLSAQALATTVKGLKFERIKAPTPVPAEEQSNDDGEAGEEAPVVTEFPKAA